MNVLLCRSISNFVTAFHKKKLPLHILANNAAVWMVEASMTEDGFEVQAPLCMHAFANVSAVAFSYWSRTQVAYQLRSSQPLHACKGMQIFGPAFLTSRNFALNCMHACAVLAGLSGSALELHPIK